MIAKLKAYALLILSGLASLLGFLLYWSNSSRKRAKQKAEEYKAQAHQARVIAEEEAEIDSEYSDARREANEDLRNNRMPDSLKHRNRLRDD